MLLPSAIFLLNENDKCFAHLNLVNEILSMLPNNDVKRSFILYLKKNYQIYCK